MRHDYNDCMDNVRQRPSRVSPRGVLAASWDTRNHVLSRSGDLGN
jgi:hypothetical protein